MIMHQRPVSTSEKKMIEYLDDLNHQKRLMSSCSEALRACTLCAIKAAEEGLNCAMVRSFGLNRSVACELLFC
jgi:hypothetical protein